MLSEVGSPKASETLFDLSFCLISCAEFPWLALSGSAPLTQSDYSRAAVAVELISAFWACLALARRHLNGNLVDPMFLGLLCAGVAPLKRKLS